MTDPGFSSPDVCRLARVTFRQLDHWERIGLVTPSIVPGMRGSGRHRRWSRDDVVLVAAIALVAPPLRSTLAAAMRGLDGSARYVVIVGDWSAHVVTSDDDLVAALRDENCPATVVLVDTLVEFDAA